MASLQKVCRGAFFKSLFRFGEVSMPFCKKKNAKSIWLSKLVLYLPVQFEKTV